ncbi:hypothetical protein BAU14_00745 [Enterococcus sp. CU9D]|nr:hypothetical protein BAU14_00745 [Enterococcus sp. CU9D]
MGMNVSLGQPKPLIQLMTSANFCRDHWLFFIFKPISATASGELAADQNGHRSAAASFTDFSGGI